jgi:TrmH family RNA methyltransferase
MQTLSKAKLTFFSSLKTKKYRQKEAHFLVEGEKMVREALASDWEIEALVMQEAHIPAFGDSRAVQHFVASPEAFARISSQQQAEGILAILPIPATHIQQIEAEAAFPPGPGLILSGLRDPGNMGTILRSADWFGFSHILLSADCVDLWNPKVVRASMGSIFRVRPYLLKDIEGSIRLHASRCWVADMGGEAAQTVAFPPDAYLVIGSESQGIPAAWREIPELSFVSLPRVGGGESLNAAMTAAILTWHLRFGSTR